MLILAWLLLFVPEFDFLLLMDVIVGGKWLCNDFHSDAYLDMLWIIMSQNAVVGL